MKTRRIISLVLVVVSLSALSCAWFRTKNYNVDKFSPNGTYRVKFDVRVEEEGDFTGHFTEQGKIQFFKGAEVLHAREWEWKDNWEATSIDNNPVVEWLGENVVRMGRARTEQPFADEISVSNNSGERLKYLSVTCDKSESFGVLDIAPGDKIMLHASPVFVPDNFSSVYNFAGYSGETASGKKFEGLVQDQKRKTPADGQLKFQITINPTDLKSPTKNER